MVTATGETTRIEVGAGILDGKNINDRNYRVYEVTGPGYFAQTRRAFTNPERIAEDAAKGGDGTFTIVDFRLPVTQLYPELGVGEEREIIIDLSRAQAEAILEGREPSIHVGSGLGRFAKAFDTLDAPAPDSDDIQGEVILVAQYSVEDRNGRRRNRVDVLAHLGDRLNYDLERAKELIEEEQTASKARR